MLYASLSTETRALPPIKANLEAIGFRPGEGMWHDFLSYPGAEDFQIHADMFSASQNQLYYQTVEFTKIWTLPTLGAVALMVDKMLENQGGVK
jgi:hypothetical protein